MYTLNRISFPPFSGIRCLMMPYIQGDVDSVPENYRRGYEDIIENNYLEEGKVGFLTIDESPVQAGKPHRGDRAKFGRALHTEAGKIPGAYQWGGNSWGGKTNVTLRKETQILLANNLDNSCALWDATHENTSEDGDIGNFAHLYPIEDATLMKAGEVHKIGILTPHESLPVKENYLRQFLRIVGKGVMGRESYFTVNPLVAWA